MATARLLLVDDEPQMGFLVGVLAKKAGYHLAHAADVEQACAAIGRERPDLVLLDMNLPGHRGDELLRRLGDRPPVALFCQLAQVRDVAAGWAAGADYLLPKDLVAQPAAWGRRVAEIFAHRGGKIDPPRIPYSEGAEARTWAAALNEAREVPEVRALGPEVVEQVFRRSLDRVWGHVSADWLSPERGCLITTALPDATAAQVHQLLTSYLDQIWCLLGPAARRASGERLTTAFGRHTS